MAAWEWFSPIERRIEEWVSHGQTSAGRGCVAIRKSYHRALQLAQQVIALDELDEPAWEIAIFTLLESGDRPAAQRELRRYREITQRGAECGAVAGALRSGSVGTIQTATYLARRWRLRWRRASAVPRGIDPSGRQRCLRLTNDVKRIFH